MEAYFRLSEVHPTAGKTVGPKVQRHQVKKNVRKQFISYDAYNTVKHISQLCDGESLYSYYLKQ